MKALYYSIEYHGVSKGCTQQVGNGSAEAPVTLESESTAQVSRVCRPAVLPPVPLRSYQG